MAHNIKNFVSRIRNKPAAPSKISGTFATAPEGNLFPKTDPLIDGEDCLHDCEDCTVKLPSGFKIDEEDALYGQVKGWNTHLIVATGKTDWVRDVADEAGSVMEAVGKGDVKPDNGKLMLSASNMPLPADSTIPNSTTVLLLPAFTYIDNVTPASVPTLITQHINKGPTNTTPLLRQPAPPSSSPVLSNGQQHDLRPRPCPHKYLILLCSQKTRDARCGQSAPLLKREFERHLRPLGLFRDPLDERPGGVGIYFISHVGGHKYSANCFVYRRADAAGVLAELPGTGENGTANGSATNGDAAAASDDEENTNGAHVDVPCTEAAQCIWLARVRPEDCENIVRYTILQGKVVKPERQLRGGFDRGRELVSW